MPLKFNNNLSNIEDRTPSGLGKLDVRRTRRRDERNLSMKIQKLYGSTFPKPIYIGLENRNILGSESGVGLGIENQPQV